MGAWGIKAWENDEAADWFGAFMEKVDTNFILEEAERMLKTSDDFDGIRAIAYVLGHFGKVYIWPIEEIDRMKDVKGQVLAYLESMIKEDSEYMDMWDNDEGVKLELTKEIELLRS